MALNASKVKQTGNGMKSEPLEAGNYLGRVVQVLDLGVQNQRPYKGEAKPPAHEISVTYELGTEFLKGADGEDDLEKPRWVSETFPLRSIKAELATSTKRLKALDPKNTVQGDFSRLLGATCTITVVQNEGKGAHAGKIYVNVGNVTPAMKGIPVPELVNESKFFDLDQPELEVFESLPEWIRDKICGNLNYNGSVLQKKLEGDVPQVAPEPEPEITSEDTPDEDSPY